MHNWRLLLLAFLAAFQPISTYTERNFDGRQQCSDRSPLRDTELLYGRHRSNKFAPEDRRLNYPETGEVRLDTHRYEVKDRSLTQTTGKRIVGKPEREVAWQSPEQARFSRTQYRDRGSRESLTDVSQERVANIDRVRNSREEDDRRISTGDSNRRAERIQEVSRDRSERSSRDVRRDPLSHTERRIKGSFNVERSWLSFDARREARRARDLIGQSQKNAETRETRITLKKEWNEVARRQFSRSSEDSRIQERIGQENRRISFRRNLRLHPRESKTLDRISDGERRSSLNRGGDERRELRREARDENRAREERHLTQRERAERSRNLETRAVRTERSVEYQRKTELRIDNREERRTPSRVSERNSQSRKSDFYDTRMKSYAHSERRDDERLVRSLDSEVRRVDVQRINEREFRIIRENSRNTEGRERTGDSQVKSNRAAKTSRSRETLLTPEVDSRSESNRNLERRQIQTNGQHDVSRDAPSSRRMKSNQLSRSITNLESKRVVSRRVNERESQRSRENVQGIARQDRLDYFRERKIQPSRSADLSVDLELKRGDTRRTSVQRNSRTNNQVDITREKRVDSNILSRITERFADSETRRRINEPDSQRIREINQDMKRGESRTSRAKLTRSVDREIDIETRRIDSRRVNERESKTIHESSHNMARPERRSNVRLSYVRDSRLSQSADRISNLEARRVDSQRVNERESRRIRDSSRDMDRLQQLSNDALERRLSRSTARVADLEARRVDLRRVNQRESRRIPVSSQDMARPQQRSTDALERRLSRSADRVADLEARRIDSRRVNKRESRRIRDSSRDMERLQQISNDALDRRPSRSTDRVADLENRRVDSRRVNERESRRIPVSSQDMVRPQRRSNDALKRRLSRSADRVADLEARRVDSRRVNQRESRRLPISSQDMARLQQRSTDALETRQSRSADRVADLEARRIDSRRNDERESRLREKYLNLERRSADRLDTFRESLNIFTRKINGGESPRIRESLRGRNIRLDAKIIKSFALERDSIESRIQSKVDLVKNRDSWNLNDKDLEDSKPFTMNWQYIFYTLQGIYLSSMLLQVLGSDKKKIRSHGVWETAQKLIKVD